MKNKELLKNIVESFPVVADNTSFLKWNAIKDTPYLFERELLIFSYNGEIVMRIPYQGVCIQIGNVFTTIHLRSSIGKTLITADGISKKSELDAWDSQRGFEIAYGRALKLLKEKVLGNGGQKIHHNYKG